MIIGSHGIGNDGEIIIQLPPQIICRHIAEKSPRTGFIFSTARFHGDVQQDLASLTVDHLRGSFSMGSVGQNGEGQRCINSEQFIHRRQGKAYVINDDGDGSFSLSAVRAPGRKIRCPDRSFLPSCLFLFSAFLRPVNIAGRPGKYIVGRNQDDYQQYKAGEARNKFHALL